MEIINSIDVATEVKHGKYVHVTVNFTPATYVFEATYYYPSMADRGFVVYRYNY